jgi:transketolase
MRTALLEEINTLAETNQDLMLVVGDLGFGVVEGFANKYPERFLNAGVAEQNMASVAAGLAHSGMRPIIYSIANFPTLRCLEQIRNDIVYHSLPVIIVSVGAGLSYGSLGYSHFAIEDMAIMGSLPNLSVFSPADPAECRASLRTAFASMAPSYIRIGRTGEPSLHDPAVQFSVQRA